VKTGAFESDEHTFGSRAQIERWFSSSEESNKFAALNANTRGTRSSDWAVVQATLKHLCRGASVRHLWIRGDHAFCHRFEGHGRIYDFHRETCRGHVETINVDPSEKTRTRGCYYRYGVPKSQLQKQTSPPFFQLWAGNAEVRMGEEWVALRVYETFGFR
jgi:hypothetical protein